MTRALTLKSKQAKPLLNLTHRNVLPFGTERRTFKELVKEAIKVSVALIEMDTPSGRKLSSSALERETLATIKSSPERIEALRATIEERTTEFTHTRGSLNRMVQFLRGPNWASAPKEARRLSFLMTPESNAELMLRKFSPVELYCVAIRFAGEKYPESFGTNTDSVAWESNLEELREQQCALFAKIALALTADDIHIGTPDPKGNAVVSFKLSNGRVPIAPQENAGERLVNFLIANGPNRT